jgi:hypothetical protein
VTTVGDPPRPSPGTHPAPGTQPPPGARAGPGARPAIGQFLRARTTPAKLRLLLIYQNEYLPEGSRDVNAVVTVTSAGAAGPAAEADSAEIIIVDCSGSMGNPRTKIAEARAARATAVDVIRDGVAFAVMAGTHQAVPVFPPDGGLAVANPETRESAKRAVAQLQPDGGTAIGQWLRLAHQMFASHRAQLRHAILLTDGKDEHETPDELGSAIRLCEGAFSCDCRGVGTDWEVAELRRISTALLGTVDIVPDPAGLAADFSAMMAAAMGKQVAAAPSEVVMGQGLVRATWTDDDALSTRINSHVAHYTGQAELAQAIQEGLEARKQGDEDTATAKLGRAVALAQQSGNEDTANLLAKVVDVVDAATGAVRLKQKVEDADEMALDTRSTKTVRTRK